MIAKELPEGYKQKEVVDLAHNKFQFIVVNVLSVVLMLGVLLLGVLWKGFSFGEDYVPILIALAVLLVGYFAYIVLHELTHGAVMFLLTGDKPDFGVKLPFYAYAGTDRVYFGKWEYILVAMAPVVLWGIVFGVLAVFLEGPFFWAVMFLQGGNVGGAAGDLFVTVKTLAYKKDTLVQDTGVHMCYYTKEEDVA